MHLSKPAAALTSGLLARKGGAHPAMRRQFGTSPVVPVDDLGWNDMGDEAQEPASPVASQMATLQTTLNKEAEVPAPPAPADLNTGKVRRLFGKANRPAAEPVSSRKSAAFTLRIDAERHLRLRLLSAVSNRSAQQLLTEAFDALVAAHPDIEALATDPKTRSAASGKSA